MKDEVARCGYSKCRAELPAPGPQGGRRRAFCKDTRWDGGRSCAQMARAERDALDALGLDSGRSAFGLDADRLREHVEAVRGPVAALDAALAAVTARLDEVEQEAVEAVGVANTRVAEAERVRVAAEEAREEALRAARQSAEAAERAGQERAEAVQRASAAARQAMEATEGLGAARQQAAEATTAREAAETHAAAAAREAHAALLAAQRATTERDAEAARVVGALATVATLTADLTTAHRAEATAVERAESAKADRDTERAARQGLEAQLAEARQRIEDAVATAERRRAAHDEQQSAARAAAERHRVAHDEQQLALRAATERAEVEQALRLRAEADIERLRAELEAARPSMAELRALLGAARAGVVDEAGTGTDTDEPLVR